MTRRFLNSCCGVRGNPIGDLLLAVLPSSRLDDESFLFLNAALGSLDAKAAFPSMFSLEMVSCGQTLPFFQTTTLLFLYKIVIRCVLDVIR